MTKRKAAQAQAQNVIEASELHSDAVHEEVKHIDVDASMIEEASTVREETTTVRRIEKARETRNNVTERSVGGLCHEVWATVRALRVERAHALKKYDAQDFSDIKSVDFTDTDTLCTVKEIRAALAHRNQTNVTAEYYAYRKFCNIRARV